MLQNALCNAFGCFLEASLDLGSHTLSGDGLVDGLGHILDVALVQAAHADSARLQQVDAELLDQDFHLFLCCLGIKG